MNNPLALDRLLSRTKTIEPWMVEIRRRLHQRPELMYQLHQTSAVVQETLDQLGITFEAGIAETGIVATLGDDGSRCVALRADMDALPIHEEADVDFRSEIDGKMHACGHDCHTAMLLGAAKILKEMEAELSGTVKFFFQPAEEGGAGAKKMCDEGVMSNPTVEKVFGLHIWPMAPSGTLTGCAGTFLAAATTFDVLIKGKGGHAAMPHMTIDPVATAAKIITDCQTIISREQDPLEAAVVSFTVVQAGHVHNVIPAEASLKGTIRSLTSANLNQLKVRLQEMVESIAKLNRCEAEVTFLGIDYPETSNDPVLWQDVHAMGERLVGAGNFPTCNPTMGGEDFAFYGAQAPTAFVALGSGNEHQGCVYGLHHPKFKVDESVFHIGAALHVAFASEHLANPDVSRSDDA